MMTGTSGRAARAFGNSSRPLIPGMLMSERIKIREALPTLVMRWSAALAGLRKLHQEATRFQVVPEPLPEQQLDIGFIVNNQNEDAHPRISCFAARRGRPRAERF